MAIAQLECRRSMTFFTLPADDLEHVLAHTRNLWEELRGQRIFLTGGTGFFGVWLVETFLWANEQLGLKAEIHVLSRNPAAFLNKMPHLAQRKSLTVHSGDVISFAFPNGPYSHIIHAATAASAMLNAEAPLTMVDTIVSGTRRTLDFARFCGAKKLLLTSSGAVYGRQPSEMTHVPEEYQGGPDALDPGNAYGEGKRMAEHLCALYAKCYGLETKIARCFAFCGPNLPLDIHFAIGNFLRDAMAGGPIRIQGDGSPYRSYLYAADLAVWLWTILFRGATCRPYNVGSDANLTIRELAETVVEAVAPAVKIEIAQQADPAKPKSRYVPSIDRARGELGLEVAIDLKQSLRRWHRYICPNMHGEQQ